MRKIGMIAAVVLLAGGAVVLQYVTAGAADELSTVNADKRETSFGDLTADALCTASNTTIALVAAVSFKSGTIPANKPTEQQITSLLQTPDETWAVSKLTGAQIREALERSLSRLPLPNSAFLQVSGLKIKYDPKAPRNQRITSLATNTQALEDGKEYQVVMPLFLAKGGSGYFKIFGEDNIVRRGSTGLATIITSFVDSKDQLNYTGQGRITVGR